MATFTYTAKRSLFGSALVGDQITLVQKLTRQVPRKQTTKRTIQALAGGRDNLVYRREVYTSCTTGALSQVQLDELLMFLDSVDAGEAFDVDGSTVDMDGDYSIEQVSPKPLWRVSFTYRKVA